MAGTCIYCGFSGTNDEMADHAGECPEMLHEPEDIPEGAPVVSDGLEDACSK